MSTNIKDQQKNNSQAEFDLLILSSIKFTF